jgi:hypothetical protein
MCFIQHTEVPSFQNGVDITFGQIPEDQPVEWIDSAIFVHGFMEMPNVFIYAEMIHGPLASVIRYFKEGMFSQEFQTQPQVIFSKTSFRRENGTPWQLELLDALMNYAGFTKPVLSPADLKDQFGVHPDAGGKWMCARKMVLPGHVSTPVAGKRTARNICELILGIFIVKFF